MFKSNITIINFIFTFIRRVLPILVSSIVFAMKFICTNVYYPIHLRVNQPFSEFFLNIIS